jgi:hypothetical protein
MNFKKSFVRQPFEREMQWNARDIQLLCQRHFPNPLTRAEESLHQHLPQRESRPRRL